MNRRVLLPSLDALRALLDHNPETGDLVWKVRPVRTNMFRTDKAWNAKWAGKKAGWLHQHGYVIITISDQDYRAHRICWKLVYGYDPCDVDHINGNPADNRISNLRLTTMSDNLGNSKRRSDNSTGMKGVCFDKARGKFRAECRSRHIGRFNTAEEAHAAYIETAKREFGEFFNPG